MDITYQETEVKILIRDLDSIRELLETLGAECLQDRIHEHNTRYDMDGSLTDKGAVLRLREDDGIRLTYKESGSIERGIISREELEVEVSDFAIMEAILAKFAYLPTMTYEKYRAVYILDGAEIMLDELPFGDFVEVEGNAPQIEAVLAKLGLQNVERCADSYSKLFEYVQHHLGLNFRDLTFDNFEDIDVPESAFTAPGSIVIG